jgi:hypothetical protein
MHGEQNVKNKSNTTIRVLYNIPFADQLQAALMTVNDDSCLDKQGKRRLKSSAMLRRIDW